MLAVFQKSVAEGPPELKCQKCKPTSAQDVLSNFKEQNPKAVTVNFNEHCALSYTHDKQLLACPRQFAAADDVFCLFAGNLENLCQLRQTYGLTRTVTEVQLMIEVYKVLRDRGPYTADQVMGDLKGSFTFVLYDHKCQQAFVAADHVGKVPFFWGTCSDGSLAISDNADVLRQGCGNSFAPFPRGCFFSSKDGMNCYSHPTKALKPIPHVDSQGQLCGSTFRVDSQQDLTKATTDTGKSWLSSF